jgi:hypothetical protein
LRSPSFKEIADEIERIAKQENLPIDHGALGMDSTRTVYPWHLPHFPTSLPPTPPPCIRQFNAENPMPLCNDAGDQPGLPIRPILLGHFGRVVHGSGNPVRMRGNDSSASGTIPIPARVVP